MTRPGRSSSRRGQRVPTAAALALVVLAASGCATAGSTVAVGPPTAAATTTEATTGATVAVSPVVAPAPAPANPGPAPAASPSPTTTPPPTASPTPSTELPIYFVRDGKLGVARRSLPADLNLVNNTLGSLLAGPTPSEEQAGLSTAIPSLTRVQSTTLMDDVAVVNLTGSFSALGPQTSPELRLAQIVYTLSSFPVRVQFQIDGQTARAVGGFALPDRPLTRDDFAAWAPPILVESVGPGEVLTAASVISGSTAVAGAGVGVRVTDASGLVLFDVATTAAKG
ncbi:MAG TPA: GerMN domain-containing protein, partial [Acidimicrobiales bacterium]